jgi:hypothetical protein
LSTRYSHVSVYLTMENPCYTSKGDDDQEFRLDLQPLNGKYVYRIDFDGEINKIFTSYPRSRVAYVITYNQTNNKVEIDNF